jgi:WD40 repeat protein
MVWLSMFLKLKSLFTKRKQHFRPGVGSSLMRLCQTFVFAIAMTQTTGSLLFAGPVTSISWSPDGKAVLFNQAGMIRVWNVECGSDKDLPWITTPWRSIGDFEFSPDGRFVAIGGGAAGETGELRVYQVQGRELLASSEDFRDIVTSVSWSPDSSKIAAASYDHTIGIWSLALDGASSNPERLVQKTKLEGHARAVLDVCFTNDGDRLVSCGSDRSIKIWDLESGEVQRSLSNHTDRILSLAPRPSQFFNGSSLPFTCASASDDQTVRVWQPVIGRMVRIVRGHQANTLKVLWDPAGQYIYSSDSAGVIRCIDGGSDQILSETQTGMDWIYSMAFSADGKKLAAADWLGVVQVWKVDSEGLHLTHTLREGIVKKHE